MLYSYRDQPVALLLVFIMVVSVVARRVNVLGSVCSK